MGFLPRSRSCLCERHRGHWFYGPAATAEPDVTIDATSNGGWNVSCRRCGTRWSVAVIHGGGIYSDYEWTRL